MGIIGGYIFERVQACPVCLLFAKVLASWPAINKIALLSQQ